MILKFRVGSVYQLGPGEPKRHEEPVEMMNDRNNDNERKLPDHIVDYLNPTEDREASEESHCSSNKTQLGFQSHLYNFTWYIKLSFFTFTSLSISSNVAVPM